MSNGQDVFECWCRIQESRGECSFWAESVPLGRWSLASQHTSKACCGKLSARLLWAERWADGLDKHACTPNRTADTNGQGMGWDEEALRLHLGTKEAGDSESGTRVARWYFKILMDFIYTHKIIFLLTIQPISSQSARCWVLKKGRVRLLTPKTTERSLGQYVLGESEGTLEHVYKFIEQRTSTIRLVKGAQESSRHRAKMAMACVRWDHRVLHGSALHVAQNGTVMYEASNRLSEFPGPCWLKGSRKLWTNKSSKDLET